MIIETERLILRPFQEEDAVDVFEYLKGTYGELLCLHEGSLP